jgi:soluble lytic murein transglycosylase-like protein
MKNVVKKNPSSEVIALWFISAIMILSVFTFTPHNPQVTFPRQDQPERPATQRAMIPSLFPDKLLAFDPVKKLETVQALHPDRFFNLIIQGAANRHNVDSAMVKAIILAESGYDIYAISTKGAMGLMQLMPVTAKELGVENTFNPVQNIYAGVKYFKILLNRFNGDTKLALAAYNAGIGRVKEYKGVPPFRDTRHYIRKVLQYHRYYRAQADRRGINEWQYFYIK